jgi:spore coat polysaccharide biosynthesis protein SpsF
MRPPCSERALDMAVAAIVQARTGSTRLPGKVLRDVAGKPILEYLIERLEHATLIDGLVVATSDDVSDDVLAAFCHAKGLDCYRGPLEDVAGRILGAARTRGLDAFVRISADSPLLDQSLVDQAVALLDDRDCELATNVHPRTFPHGQSVEAFRTDAFERGYEAIEEPADLEHVTPFFYRNAHDFRICPFTYITDLSSLQLAVDVREDLVAFGTIIERMRRPHWQYSFEEIVGLARRLSRQ